MTVALHLSFEWLPRYDAHLRAPYDSETYRSQVHTHHSHNCLRWQSRSSNKQRMGTSRVENKPQSAEPEQSCR